MLWLGLCASIHPPPSYFFNYYFSQFHRDLFQAGCFTAICVKKLKTTCNYAKCKGGIGGLHRFFISPIDLNRIVVSICLYLYSCLHFVQDVFFKPLPVPRCHYGIPLLRLFIHSYPTLPSLLAPSNSPFSEEKNLMGGGGVVHSVTSFMEGSIKRLRCHKTQQCRN